MKRPSCLGPLQKVQQICIYLHLRSFRCFLKFGTSPNPNVECSKIVLLVGSSEMTITHSHSVDSVAKHLYIYLKTLLSSHHILRLPYDHII